MRHAPAKAEELLWSHLRNRKLGGFKFRRQQPVGPYVADFFCPERKLIIELDGDTHDGRETYDEKRSRWLKAEGYKVLRFLNEDVYKHIDAVLESILRTCQLDK